MISILDYNVGNIQSIHNMLNRIGVLSRITSDIEEIEQSSHLILPGVGSFDHCMSELKRAPFYNKLEKWVFEDKKPILGICVGHQMLFDSSEEGVLPGLGWIKGKVKKFSFNDHNRQRIPHMGWNHPLDFSGHPLFEGLDHPKFYFVHSYFSEPMESLDHQALVDYGFKFVASVHKKNIFGVQFHPEKSHKYGMKLYENFAKFTLNAD